MSPDVGSTTPDLGIATHYVSPNSINDIIFQISQLQSPSAFDISKVVASYTIPASSGVNSKEAPEATTPITGEIRSFLDKAFGNKSIPAVYEALEKAVGDEKLSEEVKSWAKVQKEMMEQRSPTGMSVALEAFRRARSSMRLDEVLKDGMWIDRMPKTSLTSIDISMATAFCVSRRRVPT